MTDVGIGINESKNQYIHRGKSVLSLDGVDDYGITLNKAIIPKIVTYETWFKVNGFNEWQAILSNLDHSTPSSGVSIVAYSKGNLRICTGMGSAGNYRYTTIPSDLIKLYSWIHVAVSFNGTEFSVYLNGDLAHSWTEGAEEFTQSEDYVLFGRWATSYSGYYYDGDIKESRIWKRALTQEEIQTYMNTDLTGNEPDLIGYWKSNEGAGNTIRDFSPNKNHIRLNGGMWKEKKPQYTLFLDGVDDQITIPQEIVDHLDTCTEATLQIRLKKSQHDTGSNTKVQGLIQLSGYNDNNGNLYGYHSLDDTIVGIYIDTFLNYRTGKLDVGIGDIPRLDEWHWLTITTSPNDMYRIYLNDLLLDSRNPLPKVYVKNELYPVSTLGLNSANRRFQGDMQDFRLYDRHMGDDEISRSINEEPSEEGLILRWKMNEGAGNILRDTSINDYKANKNGAAWIKIEG